MLRALIPLAALLATLALPTRADDSLFQQQVAAAIKRVEAAEHGHKLWTAVRRLSQLGSKATPQIVARLKADGQPGWARIGLARALIRIGDKPKAVDALLSLAASDEGREVRVAALRLCQGALGPKHYPRLTALMLASEDDRVKVEVVRLQALELGTPESFTALRAILIGSSSRAAADEAALALGEAGRVKDARRTLERLAEEPDHRGRLAKELLAREREARAASDGQKLLDEVINRVLAEHIDGSKTTREKLVEEAIRAVAGSLDRYSSYWSPDEYRQFLKDMKGNYAGIGAYVGFRNNVFSILQPIYSGPAYRAGLRSRDQILEVDGWPTAGKTVNVIISKVVGTPGTNVKLKVYREGWDKAREMVITRASINVPSVYSDLLPGGVGYIKLEQFGERSASELKAALTRLQAGGAKGMILDLRGNGGGFLLSAIEIVDAFIGGGKLVAYSQTRDPKSRENFHTTEKTIYPDGPLVVLIDGDSASASEIVSGALKVHERATLIGERTYGKGSVQMPLRLASQPDGRLKLTVRLYYLPNGESIRRQLDREGREVSRGGIAPDIEVKPAEWSSWKNEAMARLRAKRAFRDYLDKHYAANKELFGKLADNDDRDISKYPGFEAWYGKLVTKADPQDAREWLRDEVRLRVSDDRGKPFAHDLVEDPQLQKAVLHICGKLGVDARKLPRYQRFAKK